jgi:hypothetical protein
VCPMLGLAQRGSEAGGSRQSGDALPVSMEGPMAGSGRQSLALAFQES